MSAPDARPLTPERLASLHQRLAFALATGGMPDVEAWELAALLALVDTEVKHDPVNA